MPAVAAVPCSSGPSGVWGHEMPSPPAPVKCQSAPGRPQQELQQRELAWNRDGPAPSALFRQASAYAVTGHVSETAIPASKSEAAGSRMASEETMPAPPSESQLGVFLDKATSIGTPSVQLSGAPINVPFLKPPPVTATSRRRAALASIPLSTDGCRLEVNGGRRSGHEVWKNHVPGVFDERLHWWPLHELSGAPVSKGPQPTTPTLGFSSRNHVANVYQPLRVPVLSSLPTNGGRRATNTSTEHHACSTTRLIQPNASALRGTRKIGCFQLPSTRGWLFMLALTAASVISFCASYTVSDAVLPHRLLQAAAENGERLTVPPPPHEAEYQHSAAFGGHHKFHHHRNPHPVDSPPGEGDRLQLHVRHEVPTEKIVVDRGNNSAAE